jgi:pimeloyl-ACP methyl ester carboxylesterase
MTLYVERSGAGSPLLVFVHGFGCSHEDWSAQRRALEARHEVVACDLPGHGRTPGRVQDAGVEHFAREVAGLLSRPAVLIGHSMGCRVVLQAAAYKPDAVRGLVLVDGSRVGMGDPARARETVAQQLGAVGYGAFIDAFFVSMIFRPLPQREALLARAKRLPEDFGRALFLDIVRWDAAALDAALAAVRAPLLAIQSTAMNAERKRVTLRAGESSPWLDLLRARVRGARIEIIPGVGHFTQLEAPDEVSRLIGDFAGRLQTPTPHTPR